MARKTGVDHRPGRVGRCDPGGSAYYITTETGLSVTGRKRRSTRHHFEYTAGAPRSI